MENIDRLGSHINVRILPDEHGLIGRECPKAECEGYFKIQFGTGLKGDSLPCHCPYCAHSAAHTDFFTKVQIEYAKSVALNEVTGAVLKDLKSLEFNHRSHGAFGFGISMKVSGEPTPIHYYREKQLETEVICDKCTLRYMIYGVFGFCPDCGVHNSMQILEKNLELVEKMLTIAETQDQTVASGLIENALEDCVSAFDGFGREICRVHASRSDDPPRAGKVSFQNLDGAKQNIMGLFNVDLTNGLSVEAWKTAIVGFQKRHLFSHKMGVADVEYIRKSGDHKAVVGRKVNVSVVEVRELVQIIACLGKYLSNEIEKTSRTTTP